MKIYLLSYNPFEMDPSIISSILSNKMIISEWLFAFPGTAYVKTEMSLKNFRDLINLSTNGISFIVTEINLFQQDGSMPFDIWSWLANGKTNYLNPLAPPL